VVPPFKRFKHLRAVDVARGAATLKARSANKRGTKRKKEGRRGKKKKGERKEERRRNAFRCKAILGTVAHLVARISLVNIQNMG
jgi:hypothetical protein